MKRILALTLMVLFIAWPFYAQAKTIAVSPDENCSCCPEATDCYTNIQSAIFNAQSGDVIVVCEGVYYENIEFIGIDITVRSSDPNDPETVAATVIDGNNKDAVVSFFMGEDLNTILSGFTIRNGIFGGIYCESSSPQITHCRIINNSTDQAGGGIYCENASPQIIHCTISSNSADYYGGGIFCTSSSPVITYCTISENNGGGIYCEGDFDPNIRTNITHCIINGNKVNPEGQYGNGVYCDDTSPVISDCIIYENSDSGIYCENASSATIINNCTITSNEGDGIGLGGLSSSSIHKCIINNNKGTGICCNSSSSTIIEGSAINSNESYGIYCNLSSTFSLTDSNVNENKKDGIYCENSALDIDNCNITGNDGNGIKCSKDSSPRISHCSIEKNVNSGIYTDFSTLNIDNCNINKNEKGGIYCTSSSPEISNCIIKGNTSDNGGGIYCRDAYSQSNSSSHIINCEISENRASASRGAGGGIYSYNLPIEIDNCIIRNNSAYNGGGIYSYNTNQDYAIDITRCSIIENISSYCGGGIYCQSLSANATNCILSYNKSQHGGGVYCRSYTMNFIHCTIVENHSTYYGGITCGPDSTIIKNCIIWNNSPSEIYGGNPIVTYSDIRGGYAGEGNIDADPLFVGIKEGNFYLNPNSPCIDHGYPKCICEGDPNCIDTGDPNDAIPIDRAGIPRPQGCGVEMGAYEYVDPNSCMPRASFTADKTIGTIPIEVVFEASSSGGYLYENPNDPNYPVFLWDFGDGNTGIGKEVSHTYTHYGFHDVSLTVITDSNSNTLTLWDLIKISPSEPTQEVGEGYEYISIQKAIDDAEDGEYILVHDGTYFENINFRGKGIHIRSENGAARAIIDGGANGNVVVFNSGEDEFSILEGLTLQNGLANEGGGIYCFLSSPMITKCDIKKNSANNSGGGIFCYTSSPLISNNIISKNTCIGDSGGIYCNYSSPYIINNTIVKNIGNSGGGISCYNSSSLIIKNCILWNNIPNEIYGNNPIVTYSDIRGGYTGEGNINVDPLFMGIEEENYYLRPNSPCIDNGYPRCICEEDPNCIDKGDPNDALPVDKECIPRPQMCGVDMGAYEYVDPNSCTPRASFTANVIEGHYPLTIRFDASSSSGIQCGESLFEWDFGDGNTAEGMLAEYTYNNPDDFNYPNDPYGSYDVSLSITNANGSHRLIIHDFTKITPAYPTKEVKKGGVYPYYNTIQDAIDDAKDGEFILVYDGTYYENIDFKGKRITVRSKNGPLTTFIDGSAKTERVVTFNSSEDKYSRLDGFTIQNGSANQGSGIYCWASSPSISNCRILANRGNQSGGGIYCYGSSSSIYNCNIFGNSNSYGGGIYINNSSPNINKCTISQNEASHNGGGIYFDHADGTVNNSTISKNIRGGIWCSASSPEIINSIIAKNKDDWAGGIHCSSASPKIVNCTIADNKTGIENGAGGIYCHNSSPITINSILWNPDSSKEVLKVSNSNPIFICSDIRNGNNDGYAVGCNIDADPLFMGREVDDYYLRVRSQCIDSGDPNEAPPSDKEGIPRPLGNGVEMGAYEYVERDSCIPRASFTASPTSGSLPQTVNFNAFPSGGSSCNDPNYPIFIWDFGDGNISQTEDLEIEHTYNNIYGFYNVSLTVITAYGYHTSTLNNFIRPYYDLEVCKGGGCDYERIQDAIDNAMDGAIILVHDGIYYENIDFKGKSITVYSANGPNETILDGSDSGSVVTFKNGEGMNAVLDGFTIQNGKAEKGGGIYCYFSSPIINNCTIRENSTINYSSSNVGGGIYCECSSPGLTNCTITRNQAYNGGGIYFYVTFSPSIINCEITKNMASNFGGGIHFSSCASPEIIHCTIADNKAVRAGGIYSNSAASITNCILWDNLPQEIYGTTCTVRYSDIKGGYTGEENIDVDPLFVAPEIGDYYLRFKSLCIDEGIYVLSFDRDEIPRPQKDGVDMGAYEFVEFDSGIPRASFTVDPEKDSYPLTVHFDGRFSGGRLYNNPNDPNYPILRWDFGDNTIIDGNNIDTTLVDHTYVSYGFYDVSLTIMTDCNSSHTLRIMDCIKLKAVDPTREVGGGYDYTSIQDAINDAQHGEYILVHDGTYSENIDFKGKGITLRSENGPEATIIQGMNSNSERVNFINSEDNFSVLEGFTVQNYPNRSAYKILCQFSSPVIKNCIIKGNSTCCTENGYENSSGIYCQFLSSPQVINCLIIGNKDSYGGGIRSYNSSPIITNCTISNNYAGSRGGAIYAENSNPVIKNSILWGNLCGNPSYNGINLNYSSTLTVTCSDIQDIPEAYTDPNLCNINADPLFVNPCGCDYRLRFDSPCIDSNCCSSDANCCIGARDDIEGKIRPLQIKIGCNGTGYDMGAYEYGISLMPICLGSNDPNTCISFGFGNEGDNVVCESQSPVLSFIDLNDTNDPPAYYCTYLKEFQQDPEEYQYQWVMKLDLEALADSNSKLLLTWDPDKLIEKEGRTWKLVHGGKVVVYDMAMADSYQINEEDGEYIYILFAPPDYHEFVLNPGWNMISIPIITTDMNRSNLFQDAMAVYYYDANQQIYIYVEEDEPMRRGLGYWVLVKEQFTRKIFANSQDDIVTSYATLDSPNGLHLEKCWNMIGSLYGYTALNVSQGYIKAVYEYINDPNDPNNNGYIEPPEFDANSGAYLVSGKGYWILPSEECYLNGNAVPELSLKERMRMLYRPRFREAASNDNWSGEITAFGQKSEDCATKARIIIGLSDTPLQIPSPPIPPCATVELNLINPPSDYTKYTKDIRNAGDGTMNWVLWVKDVESSDLNFPLLQWDIPSGLDHVLELRKGYSETGDILVEDMRTTTSYQIKQEDEKVLTVVWNFIPPKICYRDADNDTYGNVNDSTQAAQAGTCPEGYVKDSTDCDDAEPKSYPGAPEICDGKNNDCDDQVDEGLSRECSNACGEGTETCVDGKWVNCSAPQPTEETCDGKDNDCNGQVDEDLVQLCSNACGETGTETCVDGKWVNCTAPPEPEEICDGKDNDCDGVIPLEETTDADKDGFVACNDCDDNDPSVYPRLVSAISVEGYPGETDVAVPISINNAVGFAGGDISITYDPNILIARDVIAAPLIQDFLTYYYIIEAKGKVVIAIANSTALESGSGTMAEIIFDVLEDAIIGTKVPLEFKKLTLNDTDSEPYCSLGINGEFTIVERGHKGDLNQDGEITSADAIITLKISVGSLEPTDYQNWAGDVNNDDEINAADAILILKAAVTKETIFYLDHDYGLPGETVKIIGWNFGETQDESVLYFDNNKPADPVTWTDSEIVTTVPLDIHGGTVDVYLINAYGDESNSRKFTIGTSNQRLKSLNVRYRAEENLKIVGIPAGIIAAPCNQVSIPVETDDAEGIAGMDMELVFDPDVLIPVKVERTALTDGFLLMFKDSGDGRLRVSLANDAGIIEGSGALISVIFEVASAAQKLNSTGITISSIKLYDEGANLLEETISQDGQILIEGEDLCEPESIIEKPVKSSGIGALPYCPYYYYSDGYYYSPGNFSLQASLMNIFGTYVSGNGYNYSTGNSYNYPSLSGYNHLLGNDYNYPAGNGYNYPLGNGYHYPAGTGYNYLSGNSYNYTYQGPQGFLNPAFYWMSNIHEDNYNHLPNWDYQTVYPEVSRFILW